MEKFSKLCKQMLSKSWLLWSLTALLIVMIGGFLNHRSHQKPELNVRTEHSSSAKPKKAAPKVVSKKKKVKVEKDPVESNPVEPKETEANVTEQNNDADTQAAAEPEPAAPARPAVPSDYLEALNDARDYSSYMHMSRQGIYEQLVSEYGEGHSAAAAQYAVDNLQADYNYNALQSAKTYQEMGMSPEEIREQLISSYGEGFTEAEANYAVANL